MPKKKRGPVSQGNLQLFTSRQEYRDTLQRLLTSRPSKVRIVSYEADDVKFDSGQKLSDLIRRLLGQGALVTILVGKLDVGSEEFLSKLDSNGAKVYIGRRVHAKVVSWEGLSGEKILMGSANMTKGGLHDNYEIDVLIDPPSTSTFTKLRDSLNSKIDSSRRLGEYVV
jgi:phosphatidylserine/phosphatidylglycerophosphate/cardiolipin synthase-like enzyme